MKPGSHEKNIEALVVIAAGLILFYFVFKISYLLIIAFMVLLAGAFSKILTCYIAIAWFKLAEILGIINSRILLALVFYFILTPVAILKKIFSNRKTSPLPNSNYVVINKKYTAADLENTW